MLAIAAGLLRLRHERLVVKHQMAELHKDLQSKQAKLWRQQIDIATYASPQVVEQLAREQRQSLQASVTNDLTNDLTAEPTPTPTDPDR
ncbi:MAG TPA: hypothetical protein PK402_13675 [Tepidisphaeraceae bacterium]|nr:hypothetical protein [Tepidisphaeraceae bacterium]